MQRLDLQNARRAWSSIRRLMDDSDPTASRDDDFDASPTSLAISTVRGIALRAAVDVGYAVVARRIPGAEEWLNEIKTAIMSRFDASVEPSAKLRAAGGRYTNTMLLIDSTWVRRHVDGLFPQSDFGLLAFSQFLRSNAASELGLSILRPIYEMACRHPDKLEGEAAKCLGAHLTDLVAYGILDPAAEDTPLTPFCDNATVELREDTLSEVGRQLGNAPSDLDRAIGDRLQKLWDCWLERTTQSPERGDLRAFGRWFSAGVLDRDWGLLRLQQTLQLTGGHIDWAHGVVKQLQTYVPTRAKVVGNCIVRMTADPDDWFIVRCSDELKAILVALQQSEEGAPFAREVASRLLSNGHAEFREFA
jgi:hypothetical protein